MEKIINCQSNYKFYVERFCYNSNPLLASWLIAAWLFFELGCIIYFIRLASKKYKKVKYIDEYDPENQTYCSTSLEIIWLVGIVLCISFYGRVIMLIQVLSLGNYGALINANPLYRAVSPCNGHNPLICPLTNFAHVIDKAY